MITHGASLFVGTIGYLCVACAPMADSKAPKAPHLPGVEYRLFTVRDSFPRGMPCSPFEGDVPNTRTCHPATSTELIFRSDTLVGVTVRQYVADSSADLIKEWNAFYPKLENALGMEADSVQERPATNPTITAEWNRKQSAFAWWAFAAMAKNATGLSSMTSLMACDSVKANDMCGR